MDLREVLVVRRGACFEERCVGALCSWARMVWKIIMYLLFFHDFRCFPGKVLATVLASS